MARGTGEGGPRFGIGMQRYFNGCRRPLRPPSSRTCPARATGKKSVNAVPAIRRKALSGQVGTGEALGTAWPPPASPETGLLLRSWTSEGPALGVITLSTRRANKSRDNAAVITALPQRIHGGSWRFPTDTAFRSPEILASLSRVTLYNILTILIRCGKGWSPIHPFLPLLPKLPIK